jgi:cephalosporin-C deacetylase
MDNSPLDFPEDFDVFWREAVAEAQAAPLDYSRYLQSEISTPEFLIQLVDFRGSAGQTLHGWVAYPAGALQDRGFLWLAPYGQESMLPNEYGTRSGLVSFSFNFHGHGPFYREKYEPSRGYFAKGAESPDSWIFRRMFLDSVIAARVFAELPEVDPARIGSMGMSQGGGMSIWLGAWCSQIKAVCADMPFLGNIRETLTRTVHRYPLKELVEFMGELPLGEARVMNTVSYYDTVLHASRCQKPTQVALGLKDPAATPEQVRSIYGALPSTKALQTYEIGHDWSPLMLENNREWMMENL